MLHSSAPLANVALHPGRSLDITDLGRGEGGGDFRWGVAPQVLSDLSMGFQ